MVAPVRPRDLAEVATAARLSEEPALAQEVRDRLPAPSDPRPLSVSDLLSPRRAFWRRARGPAPLPLEREVRIEQGRAWHHRLGDAIAGDGRLEVRLRRGGLSARIDLLTDMPVEIKTAPPWSAGLAPADWPDQVEQLAVYCALVGQARGRLAHLVTPEDGAPSIEVGELRFHDLRVVDAEVRRRETALRAAVAGGRADRLGRCRWYDTGCEYRALGACDCRGDEPAESAVILEQLEGREPRPEIAERWAVALRSSPASGARPARYRDLLYPRRAYFDRSAGVPPVGVPARPASAPLDIYERTVAALERGPVGDLHRLVAARGAPEEEVLAWRGAPCLIRSSRARFRLGADEIPSRFPQYVVDLAFRCLQTSTERGTLVVGHDSPATGEPALQVFVLDVGRGIPAVAEAWESRCVALESAAAHRSPEALPACPAWMTTDCPYRDRCGCAPDPGRSQR